MAKIPLRKSLREIETLIDQGDIDQAIFHLKHIIRSYPKHIDSYRLLGKAFLESKRYSEASDILQRVLSVIPDDFISQIGLSIIREDEGNLDAAIWHMERAYEVQPFNQAIQEELRRLYGRRDGSVPPKIRLTRGALVRMYIRGELYPQAIAEIRAVLADDPQRYDLLVLLGRLYYLSNQKFEATEVCSTLISKLPYCYEANQILSEILPGTSRADDAKKFQQRIYALDPYSAFISPSAPTPDQVPEQAVNIEEYEWNPSEETQSPGWAQEIGVKWDEPEEEALPDWIDSLKVAEPPMAVSEDIAPADQGISEQQPPDESPAEFELNAASDEAIPDWMQEAGWTHSEPGAHEDIGFEEDDEEIQPAEIPDWLIDKSPVSGASEAPLEEEGTDWLNNLFYEPVSTEKGVSQEPRKEFQLGETGENMEISEVIPPNEPPSIKNEGDVRSEEIPEWLVGNKQPEEEEPAVPDWLITLQEESQTPAPEIMVDAQNRLEPEIPAIPQSAADEADLPDWLKHFGEEPEAQVSISGMPEAQDETIGEISQPDQQQEPTFAESEIAGMPVLENKPSEEQPGIDQMPDWLSEFEEMDLTEQTQIVEGGPTSNVEIKPVEPSSKNEQIPVDQENLDDAMAWLEGLAARQGADEATLTTTPDQRIETPPDWVLEQIQADESISQDLPGESLAGPAEEEKFEVGPVGLDIPAEISQQETPLLEGTPIEPVIDHAIPPAEAEFDADSAMAWLESLAARQGADEATLTTTPDQRIDTPPEWILKEIETAHTTPLEGEGVEINPVAEADLKPEAALSDLPDWFEEIESPQEKFEPTQPIEMGQEANIPPTTVEEPSVEQRQPEATMIENPAGEQPDFIQSEPVTKETLPEAAGLEEYDSAFAWLESVSSTQESQKSTNLEKEEFPGQPDWTQLSSTEAASHEPTIESETIPDLTPVQAEESVPDWLQSLTEEEKTKPADAWLTDIQQTQTPGIAETPEKLPDWLQETQEETRSGIEAEKLTSVPEWLESLSEEESISFSAEPEPAAGAEEIHSAWEPELVIEPTEIEEKTPVAVTDLSTSELRYSLERGEIDQAIDGYTALIQKGEQLDETISALRDALYRYPVDISIWQTLGDAYARNDQLQEAIDAYTKAEELLR